MVKVIHIPAEAFVVHIQVIKDILEVAAFHIQVTKAYHSLAVALAVHTQAIMEAYQILVTEAFHILAAGAFPVVAIRTFLVVQLLEQHNPLH